MNEIVIRYVRTEAFVEAAHALAKDAGAHGLPCSISHADGIALCATAAGCDVGADVESLSNIGPDPLGVAGVVCSPQEMNALRGLPSSERAERFLFIWTLKEAVSKALGLGFQMPFERVTIGDAPSVQFDACLSEDASSWRLAVWRLPPRHVAAAAVRVTSSESIVFRFEENRSSQPALTRSTSLLLPHHQCPLDQRQSVYFVDDGHLQNQRDAG